MSRRESGREWKPAPTEPEGGQAVDGQASGRQAPGGQATNEQASYGPRAIERPPREGGAQGLRYALPERGAKQRLHRGLGAHSPPATCAWGALRSYAIGVRAFQRARQPVLVPFASTRSPPRRLGCGRRGVPAESVTR